MNADFQIVLGRISKICKGRRKRLLKYRKNTEGMKRHKRDLFNEQLPKTLRAFPILERQGDCEGREFLL